MSDQAGDPLSTANVTAALIVGLAGCAATRSYDAELVSTLNRAGTGNVDAAISNLEANNRSSDKDLLYYFELGMLQRLMTMRRLVFGLGGLQVLITTVLLAALAVYFGKTPSEAIILGASLSLSSTAIVLELLSKQERLKTNVGRTSFAVLLAQDIAGSAGNLGLTAMTAAAP